ncbi:MAG: DUF1993 domain-containing protein [Rhodoferax sp.]|nr:DUF1993 domain-containing protein [Rhodoferax sp.]
MSISMYSASVPVFTTALRNLSHFLDKTRANAEARKFDTAVLMGYRLAPDMLPFTRQVLIACDAAKLCVARISGVEAPKFEDTEATLDELQQRIQRTIDYMATVKPEQMDGTEDKEVVIPAGGGKTRTMTAEGYLKHWATPNVYFHVTTAYAILRHNGVDLGKADFLAGPAAAA